MTTQDELIKKLTTRNILALATAAVFLWTIVFTLINLDVISNLIATDATAAGISGLLVGAFLVTVKDVYQFFFRKSQAKEST